MKKLFTFLAVLLLTAMTAKAQTQPINVVCALDGESTGYFAYANVFQFTLKNSDYEFNFCIYTASGATDIVDGQTYTLADMYQDYTWGGDLRNGNQITFSSVSFVRNNWSIVVDATATDGTQYLITYTPEQHNVACDAGSKTYSSDENLLSVTMSNSDYSFSFFINTASGATDIVDGQTYTLTDMDQNNSNGWNFITGNRIYYSSVSLVRNSNLYTVNVTDKQGNQYNITYTEIPLITEPTDTVSVMMNNTGLSNFVEDYTYMADWGLQGEFRLVGFSDDGNYSMDLYFMSDHIAGSYTMTDAELPGYFKLYSHAGGEQTSIPCNNLLEATVAVTPDNYYNAHIEWVSNDGTMYDIYFTTSWPAPSDTINITMDNAEVNAVYDNTKHENYFMLIGADQNNENGIQIQIGSNQIAGTYTQSNIQYFTFGPIDEYGYINGIVTHSINDFTVNGDAKNCSTVIEVISDENKLYRIDFTYTYVAPAPIDTIDITMNNAAVNAIDDDTYNYGLFALHGADQNREYTLDMVVYSDQIAGSYTQDDIYDFYFKHNGSGVSPEGVSDFTVTGNDEQGYNTYIEILGADTILYRINYSYVVPTPIDTIDITMDNAEYNSVYSYWRGYQFAGADQNQEYKMNLAICTEELAGSYTKHNVDYEYSYLTHNDGERIGFARVKDFTVTGNALTCSTYVEIVGSDTVLYRINYTFAAVAPETTDTIDITMDNAEVNVVENYISRDGWFKLVGMNQNNDFGMYFAVYSDQIAGNYTQADINTAHSALIDFTGGEYYDIQIMGVNDFTITGDDKNCSAYLEIVGSNETLYRINYTYTYVAPVPTDSVEITMDNAEFNQVIATDGMAGILGADQNEEYVMQLVVYSDQLAGNYTKWDVLMENSGLYHLTANDTTQIEIIEIRDFTVTGDTTNCSAYIEMVSADLVLYKITFTYATEPDAVETATEPEFVVCSEGDAIMVYSEGEQNIAVFDMAGRMITYRQNASDIERIEISVPGIYVVRVGNKAVKAVVK